MKLRLRGDVRADWDWDEQRIPQVGSLFKIDDQWYRVTQELWAIRLPAETPNATNPGVGFDAGIILRKAPNVDESEWNQ